MKFKNIIVGLIVLNFFSTFWLLGQQDKKSVLQERREALLREISTNEKLLKQVQSNKSNSLTELKLVQEKLSVRKSLINNIKSEIAELDNDILGKEKQIFLSQEKMKHLKKQYAIIIRYSYLHQTSVDFLNFLFSAKNYNDAVRRITYLSKFRKIRDNQLTQIKSEQSVINSQIKQIASRKTDKQNMFITENSQATEILKEENEKAKIFTNLKNQEASITQKIAKNKQDAASLQRQIQLTIIKEIQEQKAKEELEKRRLAKEAEQEKARRTEAERIARQKAEEEKQRLEKERIKKEAEIAAVKQADEERRKKEEMTLKKAKDEEERKKREEEFLIAKKKASEEKAQKEAELAELKKKEIIAAKDLAKTNEIKNTNTYVPEHTTLGENFESSKGGLSMPVNGRIVGKFGTQPHPVFPNLKIENNGIDIYASIGAEVRAVFQGTVLSVFPTPGGKGSTLLINHGDYYTVYTNINPILGKGTKVNRGQTIGRVNTNEDGDPVMNFQIWRSKGGSPAKLNPLDWL